ncbi:MFS general substrate transporter [Mollisia scopiformis]|uniref:MFS general substrate transporter n=1 Tax=Mollisia scopiformis TaxID=149040 RepID=A0A194XWP4_MOLSC|nr:MFS general substrate transporter [Mollisia scopiformis]KUJ24444.1 MFS general substrate transporter [Mollisia scopiformis]
MSSIAQRWEKKVLRSDGLVRLAALVAATTACLGSGTNYAYSAWAPQFSERLRITSAQSNLLGIAGNIGQALSAIPIGLFIDSTGARLAAMIGGVTIAIGYNLIYSAYMQGPEFMGFWMIWCMYFLTGIGSFSTFSAAIKITALNWPHRTGAATSLPLSAFGLSAFVFTTLSMLFQTSRSQILLFIAVGAPFLILVSSPFFLKAKSELPDTAAGQVYTALEGTEIDGEAEAESSIECSFDRTTENHPEGTVSSERLLLTDSTVLKEFSQELDISIHTLVSTVNFWLLFMIFGLYTGIGSMTINNIGYDATMLWRKDKSEISQPALETQLLFHVSIISIMSFCGRLISGASSDLFSVVFLVAQLYAMWCSNPRLLWILSVLTGLAYGLLYGVYPALVTDAFGLKQLSRNYGIISLAPILWSGIFNLNYGRIIDLNSSTIPNGDKKCMQGLHCYTEAYRYTLVATAGGLGLIIWCVRRNNSMQWARRLR